MGVGTSLQIYARDSLGRVSAVTTKKDAGSSTVPLASGVAYMSFGPLQSLTYGNGLSLWKTFTQDYELDVLLVEDPSIPQDIVSRSHTRSDDLNLTNIWDNVAPANDQSFWYSATNRLQNGDGPWGELTWYYDGVGNRTYEIHTQGGATTTDVYGYSSSDNRVASVVQDSTTVRAFTHDNAGNVTADDRSGAVYNYRYNNRARLDRLTIGTTVTADYIYDGLERLALRTTQNMTPAGTTHYVYDLKGRLIAEAADTGATVREYIWLDDMPLAVVADVDTATPQLWFVHADHLDRPIKMTDATKATVWDAVYRPFGEVHSITGSATLNLRFPGQYFLIESGLAYNWHRQYDPTIGRYIQADPLEFVDGPSLYAYARSAPTMEIDPKGLQAGGGLRRPSPMTPAPTIPAPSLPGWWKDVGQVAQICIEATRQFLRRFKEDECDKQAESDEAICRSLRRPDVRSRCFESANARYGACRQKKPLPPLITW